ncbi:hypothetical protein CTEN210_05642 [Chaetoceros tenuissimus]|uniref:MYND-type domain-containing protein n=1 Tax=Chaetoceros tenuissimus TaxID=426638 RepID=A0AAD3CNE6_9STRA|nr:hypothetical protein CTEN210_05642 [Chaetoceros tenuissimus]
MENSTVLYTRTAPERPPVNVATQKGANAYLRQLRKDGMPPFSSKLMVSINQYIHKPEESIEERWRSRENTGHSTLHGLYNIMRSICENASNDLLREVVTDTELRIISNHFAQMLKYAISRENKGVIIDEPCLNEVIGLTTIFIKGLIISDDAIGNILKSLASAAKQATDEPSQDSGVGYFLCHTMIECFANLIMNKIKSADKAIMMMHKTGMLEQVLRHIHLPWTFVTNNIDIKENVKNRIRFFFITVASSTISLGKMFKAGSPTRDALVDVLQGRIKPCAENEHMMEILEALKKFIDMGLTSGNSDDQYISMTSFCCSKCEKVDYTRKLLVCGKCKHWGYCSRECQIADWKDHKQTCKSIKSLLTKRSRNSEAIATKFVAENKNSIYEAMRKCYDGGDLVLDLNFSNDCAPKLPPALRNPPEFEVLPANIFWNREKDMAPDHWFFKDLGGGKTHYTDENIKEMKKGIGSKTDKSTSHLTLNVFLKLSDVPYIVSMRVSKEELKPDYNALEEREKCESYQKRREEYIKLYSDQLAMILLVNPDVKDLSASEKEEYAKKFNKHIGELFDLQYEILNKNLIGN